MEHLSNGHKDHSNQHENSHKLCDDYSCAEFSDFLVGQDIFLPSLFWRDYLMFYINKCVESIALILEGGSGSITTTQNTLP